MKTQAFRRKPLTVKVYNRALTQCYKRLYVGAGQSLGLIFLGTIIKFYPLLVILLIVELIRLYFAWMDVEAVRDGEVDYLVGGGVEGSEADRISAMASKELFKEWRTRKGRQE